MNLNKTILAEYDTTIHLHKSFENKMHNLITDLLDSKNLIVHNITSRVKEKNSLEKKLFLKEKYTNLNEITDIVGIRIITFFEDEVDLVAKLISTEFEIDEPNSIDKRVIEYDKFGYSSLHYVVSINKQRCKLLEYETFKSFKFEIQIRSILQHAWAEIEHDIGYKSKSNIPDVVKRNFSRVAALLETSDLEFTKLRVRLLEYEKDVKEEISTNPVQVDLNDISLVSFSETNKIIDEIDSIIAKNSNTRLLKTKKIDTSDISKLQYFGIRNIEQLSRILEDRKNDIIEFAREFLGEQSEGGSVSRGISLFYLSYVYAAEQKSKEDIQEYVRTFFKQNNQSTLTDEIITTYNKIKS